MGSRLVNGFFPRPNHLFLGKLLWFDAGLFFFSGQLFHLQHLFACLFFFPFCVFPTTRFILVPRFPFLLSGGGGCSFPPVFPFTPVLPY